MKAPTAEMLATILLTACCRAPSPPRRRADAEEAVMYLAASTQPPSTRRASLALPADQRQDLVMRRQRAPAHGTERRGRCSSTAAAPGLVARRRPPAGGRSRPLALRLRQDRAASWPCRRTVLDCWRANTGAVSQRCAPPRIGSWRSGMHDLEHRPPATLRVAQPSDIRAPKAGEAGGVLFGARGQERIAPPRFDIGGLCLADDIDLLLLPRDAQSPKSLPRASPQ